MKIDSLTTKPTLKVCTKCGTAKPYFHFYPSNTARDKREGRCMDCRRKAANERYARIRVAKE